MAEKLQKRLKKLCDGTNKVKDRFNILVNLKDDGFSPIEIRDFFASNPVVVLQTYLEYVKQLESEAESKGKQSNLNEIYPIFLVFKTLLASCTEKIRTGWEAETLEEEVHCYLHVENHIVIRKQGLDLLLIFCELSPSVATEKERMNMMLSAFDWDFFRQSFPGVVLPKNVCELRKWRRRIFPVRVRSAHGGELEREKEAHDAVNSLFTWILNAETRLTSWWEFFRSKLGAIFYPKLCYTAGLIDEEIFEGFSTGLPPKLHAIIVNFLVALANKRPSAMKTVGASIQDTKWVISILASTPSIAVRDQKSIFHATQLLVSWIRSSPFQSFAESVVDPITTMASTDALRNAVTFLDDSVAYSDGANFDRCVSNLVQLESLYELLCGVVVSDIFPAPLKSTTLFQMAKFLLDIHKMIAEVKVETSAQNFVPSREAVIFLSQCFWTAVCLFAPPGSSDFNKVVLPFTTEVQQYIKSSMTMPPYLFTCWNAIWGVTTQYFISGHMAQGADKLKEKPFVWPVVPTYGGGDSSTDYRINRPKISLTEHYFKPMTSDKKKAFDLWSASLHSCFASLNSDVPIVRRSKCTELCESFRELNVAQRKGLIFVEPDAILSMAAPYLLLASQTPSVGEGVGVLATQAFDVMSEVLSLEGLKVVDSALLVGMMNAISTVVTSTNDPLEVQIRVVTALFRSNTTSVYNVPTPTFVTRAHAAAPLFMETIHKLADTILMTKEYTSPATLLEAKTAALNIKQCQIYFCYSSIEERQKTLHSVLNSIEMSIEAGQPMAHLIHLLGYMIVSELVLVPAEEMDISYIRLVSNLLLSQWNHLQERLSIPLLGAFSVILSALVFAARGKEPSAHLRQIYLMYIVSLLTAIMYHVQNWKPTKSTGPALIRLFQVATEYTTSLGQLGSKMPGNDAFTVAQLVCDVISFSRSGECYQKYIITKDSTMGHPLGLTLYAAESHALQKEGAVIVPSLDATSPTWFAEDSQNATVKNTADRKGLSDFLTVEEVFAASEMWAGHLIYYLNDFPHPIAKTNLPRSCDSMGANVVTYSINKNASLRLCGTDGTDGLELQNMSPAGESGWLLQTLHGAPSAQEKGASIEENAADLFPDRSIEENSTFASLISDLPLPTVIPKALEGDFSTEAIPPQQSGQHLQFSSAATPPQRNPSKKTADPSLLSFLSALGYLGAGETYSKVKPLTATMKPPNFFSAQPEDLCDQLRNCSPVRTQRAAISFAYREEKDVSTMKAYSQFLLRQLGTTSSSDSTGTIVEYCSPGLVIEFVLCTEGNKILTDPFASDEKMPVSIMCCSSEMDVRAVHALTPSQYCNVMIYIIPNEKEESVLIHISKSTRASNVVAPLFDGMLVHYAVLPFVLRAAVQVIHEGLNSMLPTKSPFCERQKAFNNVRLGTSEHNSLEQLLVPLIGTEREKATSTSAETKENKIKIS